MTHGREEPGSAGGARKKPAPLPRLPSRGARSPSPGSGWRCGPRAGRNTALRGGVKRGLYSAVRVHRSGADGPARLGLWECEHSSLLFGTWPRPVPTALSPSVASRDGARCAVGADSALSAGARGTSGFAEAEAEGPPRRVRCGAVSGAAVIPRSALRYSSWRSVTCAQFGTPPAKARSCCLGARQNLLFSSLSRHEYLVLRRGVIVSTEACTLNPF